jgi:hypothetical protein
VCVCVWRDKGIGGGGASDHDAPVQGAADPLYIENGSKNRQSKERRRLTHTYARVLCDAGERSRNTHTHKKKKELSMYISVTQSQEKAKREGENNTRADTHTEAEIRHRGHPSITSAQRWDSHRS